MKIQFLTLFFLLFINSVLSQNESIKSLVKKADSLNLDMWDLVDYAEENLKEDVELAQFFYYWIGSNIKYDNETLSKLDTGSITSKDFRKKQDRFVVYESRKGVCAGYANLYQWFMYEIDIEAVFISGHIRDERNHYVELESDDMFRHAWNAIKLNGKWLIVDSTWGTSNDYSVSDFYFDIKPEFSILSHFPEENKWQLLEKTLTLDEFNNSKFINPVWFFKGFSDIPKLKEDADNYYFVYRINPNNWSVNLMYSSDNLSFSDIDDLIKVDQDGYTYLMFPKAQMPEKIYFKVNLIKYYEDTFRGATIKDVINFKI
ncbi:MAG: hypothetical protein COB73_00480 [Flavobacteriaceae bacterium]|nr:MAG: hypothetical protein COB73_00480 [Flavobacteriaceae bacterium]